ncbi:MAG: hypothetical protein ACI9MR_001701, partial [Myxococcota bacterium]
SVCGCRLAQRRTAAMADITAANAHCVQGGDAASPACIDAVHTICAAHRCFDSGLQPDWLPPSFAPDHVEVSITCVAADIVTTDNGALAALEPGCDPEAPSPDTACDVAIQRLCQATGALTGSGPIRVNGDIVTVRCFQTGTPITVPWSTLMSKECLPDTRPSPACRTEVSRQCGLLVYGAAGIGPVGYADDGDANIVCLP